MQARVASFGRCQRHLARRQRQAPAFPEMDYLLPTINTDHTDNPAGSSAGHPQPHAPLEGVCRIATSEPFSPPELGTPPRLSGTFGNPSRASHPGPPRNRPTQPRNSPRATVLRTAPNLQKLEPERLLGAAPCTFWKRFRRFPNVGWPDVVSLETFSGRAKFWKHFY